MMPKWHVLLGGMFSLFLIALFNFTWINGLIIFLSSVMIDLDHYFLYVLRKRKLSPKRFWRESLKKIKIWKGFSKEEKKLHKEAHFLLHGLEMLLVLLVLSFFWKVFFFIFLGFSFHILLDLLNKILARESLASKLSQIWLWQRNKRVVSQAIFEKQKYQRNKKKEKVLR